MSIIPAQSEYPYQNPSLEDIEGEVWEDIPGLDGCYLVSNLGRIKRQRRQIQKSNGAICVMQEKIIKPKVAKLINNLKKDYTFCLMGKVVLQGKDVAFSLARLVYYCCVEPFDLDDNNTVILCKDTDNFNIQPSNLLLSTCDQKQQRAVDRKRFRSSFLDLTEEERATIRKSIVQTRSKQVTQFTLNGERIETYQSLLEATRATGVTINSIRKVALGEATSAGGFSWSW